MKTRIISLAAVIFFFLLTSCNNKTEEKDQTNTEICQPLEFGNGVYYFECYQKEFAVSLSFFIGKQDSLSEVKAITGNGTGMNGADLGYYVVIGKK